MSLLPEGLTEEELIASVRPPYPNAPFPLAVGWQVVLAVAVVGTLFLSWLSHGVRARRRRKAFETLKAIETRFFENKDVSALSSEISVLIKRAAAVRFGRDAVAGLSGRAWADFLRKAGAALSERDESLLSFQAYAPPERDTEKENDALHLVQTARQWTERVL